MKIENIEIEAKRESGEYIDINVDPHLVAEFVARFGKFKFNRPRNAMRDWIDD
jgi:hypothetical protein